MFFFSSNQFLSALHASFYTDFESSSLNHCILKKRKGLFLGNPSVRWSWGLAEMDRLVDSV